MSNNPFGKLTVRRDDDEEEVKQVQTTTTTVQQADAKKKKVRPEENKPVVVQHKEENNEGFETVGKVKTQKPRRAENNDEEKQIDPKDRKPKNKGAYANKPVREGKRQFERHSGTGRGKEIAKNGAGGHHTWGTNPKQIAKEGEIDYYSNDDKCIFF
jgi:hypothetical protein